MGQKRPNNAQTEPVLLPVKANVTGSRTKNDKSTSQTHIDEERVHTPASLFYRLWKQLREDGIIHVVDENYTPRVQEIIQFTAPLIRNPLTHAMGTVVALMEMATKFSSESTQKEKCDKKNNIKILEQLKEFNSQLQVGDTIDIIAQGIAQKYQAVITLEAGYLNDPRMADLVDGEFTVVGKLTKQVSSHESINLIRKSAVAAMPQEILDMLRTGLSRDNTGMNMPSIEVEVPGPAFLIIPIAIFA